MCFGSVFAGASNVPRFPKESVCVERFATAKRSFLLGMRGNKFGKGVEGLIIQKFSQEFFHDNCS